MMTGQGPFGPVGMGGMFSVLKVRRDQKPGDYSDPGWFKHPPGTVAYEWKGQLAPAARAPQAAAPAKAAARNDVEVTVRKPTQHKH
jgi:manganese oxidase